MAEYTRDNTSSATILVSIIVVLIIALAFYFGFVRSDRDAVGGPEGGAEVEFNTPIDGVGDGGDGGIQY